MKKIGLIGAGIMPAGMARNFLKAGYEVFMWNRSPEKLQSLIQIGARTCDSSKQVAKRSDIVIECVADDEASKSVWLGKEGILAGANEEKVLITSASLTLAWTSELAKLCEEKGLKFLDMPLTGSRAGAEGGTLKLLVGGNEQLLESVRGDLEAISDKVYYFGSSGSGMRFKLILNTLQAIQIDAAAQTIGLCKKLGLDINQVHHAIFDAPMGAASPVTNAAFQGVPADQTNFAVKWIEKDLRYTQAMLKEFGLSFNLLKDARTDYARAKAQGLADRDWTAIVELFEKE